MPVPVRRYPRTHALDILPRMRGDLLETTQGFRATKGTWHAGLEAASETDALLSLTRDYLATFAPEHLARIPEDCRPGRIKGEDDIAYWSCKLAQHAHKDTETPVDADLMQEMLNYFLHAWVRLSQIQRVHLRRAEPQYH
jgi:hypothetical protein